MVVAGGLPDWLGGNEPKGISLLTLRLMTWLVMLQHEARVIRSCCEGVIMIMVSAMRVKYQSVLIGWENRTLSVKDF